MTIEERMRLNLYERGVFDEQIDAIMKRVKAAPENKAMIGRWDDSDSDYPPALISIAWLTVKHHALTYIDENCPKAWFRPLFVTETQAASASSGHNTAPPESFQP